MPIIFMGWCDFFDMVNQGQLILRGPKKYTRIAPSWLGQSRLANIKKQPVNSGAVSILSTLTHLVLY
ncbi:hypothetical protein [Paraglaciecola hydrolytica]|uniref:Uncharacterized protein n=1 Tax=Paraglaciecola hydrolytica TaxID=1799789 RepID=A0A148KMX1_9ALTE|nr:hypothetical protein [Paraglaciecola hydrolytica]KXI27666.1 hypothetical protein AX660_19105 [Paraglaciecola hydrolytica]